MNTKSLQSCPTRCVNNSSFKELEEMPTLNSSRSTPRSLSNFETSNQSGSGFLTYRECITPRGRLQDPYASQHLSAKTRPHTDPACFDKTTLQDRLSMAALALVEPFYRIGGVRISRCGREADANRHTRSTFCTIRFTIPFILHYQLVFCGHTYPIKNPMCERASHAPHTVPIDGVSY